MTKKEMKNPRSKTGIVVSNANTDTVTVKVDEMKRHPIYHKSQTFSTKYHADTKGQKKEIEVGTKVTITETRPISKLKKWKVSEIHTK